MVSEKSIQLQTKLGTEISILKNMITQLKPYILNKGGRKFEEGGSSLGTGAAYAWLEFFIDKEKYTFEIATQGQRNIDQSTIETGWIRKNKKISIILSLEIQSTLKGNIPQGLLKSITQKGIEGKGNTKEIKWNYFIVKGLDRNQESSELSLNEMNEDFILVMMTEERNILNETKKILNDLFILVNKREEERLAAK